MNNPVHKVSVIYLSYIPYGIENLSDFIGSYKMYNSGYPHSLIILFKGMSDQEQVKPFMDLLEGNGLTFSPLYYKGDGFDINAYYWTAEQVESEYLFFLNSSSLLLAENWLDHYISNFSGQTGIISATASAQSYYSAVYQKNKWQWESSKGFLYNFRKYKLFVKAFLYWRFLFNPFPNYHLRTNGFMVRRRDLIAFVTGPVNTKFRSYRFESGRKSITAYFLKKGLKALVVDRYGKPYEKEKWAESSTYWIGEQNNLLVSDNQTRIYQAADSEKRKLMTKLAWGV